MQRQSQFWKRRKILKEEKKKLEQENRYFEEQIEDFIKEPSCTPPWCSWLPWHYLTCPTSLPIAWKIHFVPYEISQFWLKNFALLKNRSSDLKDCIWSELINFCGRSGLIERPTNVIQARRNDFRENASSSIIVNQFLKIRRSRIRSFNCIYNLN